MPVLNDAISQGRFKQVYFLMNYGIDLNTRNVAGKTALMQLCEIQPEEKAVLFAKALVERGAQIDKADRKGRNSLMYAILHKKQQLTSFFLEEAVNYDLNAKDFDGNTALSHAAVTGNLEIVRPIVRLLRKFRLSVDVANNTGETPLIQATKHGHISCAKLILTEGKASKNIRDNRWWKTALEWEETLSPEKQQKFDDFRFLNNENDLDEQKDSRRRKSTPKGCKESLTGTKPNSWQSLHKAKNLQRQEIRHLFDVYKDQFSSTYRIGFVIRKLGKETQHTAENENFDSNLKHQVEDEFEDKNSENLNLAGNSTRKLFTKSAAIVRFRSGSASRSQLSKTSSLSRSFPPDPTKHENNSLINKLSLTKAESSRTSVNRPKRPFRSKSEIPYSLISRLTSDNEKKSSVLQNNKLPRISLQSRKKTDLTISTVLEDEEED